MIGSVRGRIASKTPPQLTVDVGGLGYELEAPMSTFFHLPAVGEEVRLLTHLVVREDAHVLYAFATDEERRLFRSLIKVSGVGPRIALALFSGISVTAFAECVQARGHRRADTRAGRGPQDRRAADCGDARPAGGPGLPGAAAAAVAAGTSAESEAYGALVALGYRPAEATRLLKAVGPGTHSTEELIRRALQGAARDRAAK